MLLNHLFELQLLPLILSRSKGERACSWFDKLTMSGAFSPELDEGSP
jgi:hypothetical protein